MALGCIIPGGNATGVQMNGQSTGVQINGLSAGAQMNGQVTGHQLNGQANGVHKDGEGLFTNYVSTIFHFLTNQLNLLAFILNKVYLLSLHLADQQTNPKNKRRNGPHGPPRLPTLVLTNN